MNKSSKNNKRRGRYVVGTAIIAGSFAMLVGSSMKSSSLRAVPVSDLCRADNTPQSFVGQRVRIVGFVDKTPVKKEPVQTPNGISTMHHFAVVDKDRKVQVSYQDALPDTFRAGAPVQVDGVYATAGKMQADNVLTKCPSKYEAEGAGTGAEKKSGKAEKAKTAAAY
jgi:cytochrome c-type biogenesis protein CcmE